MACLVLVLVPQVVHNNGESRSRGALVTGYLVGVICGIGIETWTFVVIEAQFVMYRAKLPNQDDTTAHGQRTLYAGPSINQSFSLYWRGKVLATRVVFASYAICATFPMWLGMLVGSIVPSVFHMRWQRAAVALGSRSASFESLSTR